MRINPPVCHKYPGEDALPNPTFRIYFSLVDRQQAMAAQGRIAYGGGVVPLYAMSQGCDRYGHPRDAERESALSLLKTKQE